ncbi:hypothetical protein BU24DRAFT_73535 [Aaosphaeria arxii CBS 175.79]|uniref:Uncharacterized protein n=1 Tax=Aaosphaeria arxii CBS 175.79 TaxID=1450172 RepID=A0A6A5XBR6_9PLEO|nr:uncharacterized protein BU24DRAFT_73535 [Aaosphaeria arxii CBS 175.79]KAF2010247.1 hypothetical protein BU24DRAFT_73535 [Aaosphaeria arxii CBS 175.79]
MARLWIELVGLVCEIIRTVLEYLTFVRETAPAPEEARPDPAAAPAAAPAAPQTPENPPPIQPVAGRLTPAYPHGYKGVSPRSCRWWSLYLITTFYTLFLDQNSRALDASEAGSPPARLTNSAPFRVHHPAWVHGGRCFEPCSSSCWQRLPFLIFSFVLTLSSCESCCAPFCYGVFLPSFPFSLVLLKIILRDVLYLEYNPIHPIVSALVHTRM